MTQGSYISEDTNSLIRRAQQTMGEVPVLDLTNWQNPTYTSTETVRSLAGSSCHSIKIKNVISVADTSIIKCTTTVPAECDTVPANCGAIGSTTLDKYYNFVATVNAQVAQNGVQIVFKYVINGSPETQPVLANLGAGANTVYAFATNQGYLSDTELVLYGADVTGY